MASLSAVGCVCCGETSLVQVCHTCGEEFAPDGARAHRADPQAKAPAHRVGKASARLRKEADATTLRSGGARDLAADLRDRGAEARDSIARRQDSDGDAGSTPEDVLARAARDRERAAQDRARAADDRARAAADRELAAAERAEALIIRAESAGLLERAATDELTGARTRLSGLEEAAREIERARRGGGALVLAFVDVDGLKRLNDSRGHQAGDSLLRGVGEALRTNLRPYDVIVRYGGDEFICVMPDLSANEARARFARIAHQLAAVDSEHSISIGLAQAWPGEDLKALIARADADLLRLRARTG
jgi:diguanylate cyclase (GGDEF)-like protein